MLVKRAFETDGIVADSDFVMNASKGYRNGQDHIAKFISEFVEKTGNQKDRIKKTELKKEFDIWFKNDQGASKKVPKAQELYDYMDKTYKNTYKKIGQNGGWFGLKLNVYNAGDDMDEVDNS